jgi:hypothetical protein
MSGNNIAYEIAITVQPQTILSIVEGYQPALRKFATVEAMLATTGRSGDLAYCYNRQDTWWKWVMASRSWEQTSI